MGAKPSTETNLEELRRGTDLVEDMGAATVETVNNYDDPATLTEIVKDIGKGMKGQANETLPDEEKFQGRGV